MALHEKIEQAHEVYQRYAKHNAANCMLSELHDNLARLLGDSLLDERDHTPMERDLNFRYTGEIISVQDWMTTAGMTQPLAQRCERDDSIVSKEAVVETVRRNLAELRARRNDEHGLSRGVKRPIEPGPTVGAKGQRIIRQTQTQPLPVARSRLTWSRPESTGATLITG